MIMTEIDEFDIYQQRLWQYILDYHSYMIEEDEQETIEFVISRSQRAYKAYVETAYDGGNGMACEHAAFEILYGGLHFSPITYLIEVGVDNYGYEMEKEEAVEVYRNPEVREIFEKYGDDIEGDPKEHLLVEEIVPYLKHLEGRKNFIYSWQKPENDEN